MRTTHARAVKQAGECCLCPKVRKEAISTDMMVPKAKSSGCSFTVCFVFALFLTCACFVEVESSFQLPVTLPRGRDSQQIDLQQRHQSLGFLSRTTTGRCCAFSLLRSSSSPQQSEAGVVGPRISINEEYSGLERLNSNPDIFVIREFLDPIACRDLIEAAQCKNLGPSPVAYAGWTQDFRDLVELAAKGPVAWIALATAWFQVKDSSDVSQVSLVVHSVQYYAIVLAVVTGLIAAFTFSRAEGLKSLRTSTSTTLDDVSGPTSGTRKFVENAAKLFNGGELSISSAAALFEAPTVIRYEADQVLAPHFDANRSAEREDANRGGQTLATLLVYLNNVDKGGQTRFGRIRAPSTSRLSSNMEKLNDSEYLTIQGRRRGFVLSSRCNGSL